MVAMMNELLVRGMSMAAGLKARLTEERGQDLLEYAILGGFIAAVLAAALTTVVFTDALDGMVSSIAGCIDFDSGTACP